MARASHILGFADDWRGGGVERAMLRLAGGWVEQGRRVTILVGRDAGPLRAEVPTGVAIVEMRAGPWALPRYVARLGPDLIFCPGNHYTAAAAWIRLRLGRRCPPIVAKVSNALSRGDHNAAFDLAHRAWLRMQPRFVDRFVAMTPAMRAATIAATGAPGQRVAVIANPPARIIPGAPPVAMPPGRYLLGVGRLEPQKRWDRLIAAIPRLADTAIPVVILGEGRERRALDAQIAALGLGARVTLAGHAADPLPAIRDATLLALTSDYEGVPGVLREALAFGTPVVTTDSSPSVAEIVTGNALGTIVARGDGDALVAALDRWLAADGVRPAPVVPPGADSAARYLALFDALVTRPPPRPPSGAPARP